MLIGYIHGVAVVLVIGQLRKLLGLDIAAERAAAAARRDRPRARRRAGRRSWRSAALALAILLPLRFLAPRVPAALLVVVGAILASGWLDLAAHGVAVVGAIPSGLPELAAPSPPVEDTLTLLPAAVGIFLVCFADAILTARSFAGKHDEHVRVDQELLAMGAAQAAAGFTQGLPLGASGSRTAVNDAMGARTPARRAARPPRPSCVVLLFLTGPIADLPKAVLGAVIVSAAVGLVEPARVAASSGRPTGWSSRSPP